METHKHTGTDMPQVSYGDLTDRKIYATITLPGTSAATAANYGTFFNVPFDCYISKITESHEVLGTDGSAVNVNVEKLTGTTAPASGTVILATPFDLKATINTVYTGTLGKVIATNQLRAGNRLALKDTGTLTAVAGLCVVVELTY